MISTVKISELPSGSDLSGLYTLGTDRNNESVKIGLEFLKDAAAAANEAADNANQAAASVSDLWFDIIVDEQQNMYAITSDTMTEALLPIYYDSVTGGLYRK